MEQFDPRLGFVGEDLQLVPHSRDMRRRLLALGDDLHRCRLVGKRQDVREPLDVLEDARAKRCAEHIRRTRQVVNPTRRAVEGGREAMCFEVALAPPRTPPVAT